jgi:Zn finger protein HypA/HybF involved in hydrogenase expression
MSNEQLAMSVEQTIPCWKCDGTMKRYGHDLFYWFYECPKCGSKHAELREDRPDKVESDGTNDV